MHRRIGHVYLLLLLLPVLQTIGAQTATAPPFPAVLSRFGDDVRWAAPGFDDTGWVAETRAQFPVPVFASDGFVWIRSRVPISTDAGEPLALRLHIAGSHPGAAEIFVNGRAVGSEGGFPPNGFDRTRAISTQSAGQIAQAPQAHGQEDDITVLTLTLAPA